MQDISNEGEMMGQEVHGNSVLSAHFSVHLNLFNILSLIIENKIIKVISK